LSIKNHGERGEHGEKEGKALWKKGSAYLTTRLTPVIPARLLKKCFGIEDIVVSVKFRHNISWLNLTF
jgi:hypothetical protein